MLHPSDAPLFFMIHSLEQACAVIEAGQQTGKTPIFINHPAAGLKLGAQWFYALTLCLKKNDKSTDFISIFDAGTSYPQVYTAIRLGLKNFILSEQDPAFNTMHTLLSAHNASIWIQEKIPQQSWYDLALLRHGTWTKKCIEKLQEFS